MIDNTKMNRNNDGTEPESIPMASIADKDQKQEQQQQQQHNNNNSINPNHDISCHQLLWGRDSTEAFCERHFSNALSSKPLDDDDDDDHHSDDPVDSTSTSSGIDLVFGFDLIYASRVIGPLFATVSTLLKHGKRNATSAATNSKKLSKSKTIFLMAHSDRREGSSVTLNAVLDGAETAGLQFEILQKVERKGMYIIAIRIQQQQQQPTIS